MDVQSQSKSMVLAARRPLSYAELTAAVDCTCSRLILGDILEVSGGLRPIVHFKEMTALGGDATDHKVAARCCLRILNHGYLSLGENAFLRYAIEFVMKHVDNAGDDMHAEFLREFDYEKWQRWAVQLPVYAALNTYNFGAAMRRLKCFRLVAYVAEHDRLKLSRGVPGSRSDGAVLRYSLSPWRGDFETRRQQRRQQRDRLLGIGPSSWTSWEDPTPGPATVSDPIQRWPPILAEDASSSRASWDALASVSTLSTLPTPEPTISRLTNEALSQPDETAISLSSFGDVLTPSSEADLSDFEMLEMETDDEVLPWEDIDYQEAILASLQQEGEVAGR